MSIGIAHGLWSLMILIIFIAIVAFVFSAKRKTHYEDAALIPFDEDEHGEPAIPPEQPE